MAPLALIAALLLVMAPTMSRIVASAAPNAQPIEMALCTNAGSHHVGAAQAVAAEDPQPAAGMVMMADEACGYCALLPPLQSVPVACDTWVPRLPRVSAPRLVAISPASPRNLRGLGSQAPPTGS